MGPLRVDLDTSVLIALALDEASSPEQDLRLRQNATERFISSFAGGEFIDTIARDVRRHALTPDAGRAFLAAVDDRSCGLTRCENLNTDVLEAASLIADDMTRGLKLGDAIHLAICRRLGATLLTGDRRQAAAAAAFDMPVHLILPAAES